MISGESDRVLELEAMWAERALKVLKAMTVAEIFGGMMLCMCEATHASARAKNGVMLISSGELSQQVQTTQLPKMVKSHMNPFLLYSLRHELGTSYKRNPTSMNTPPR